MSGVIDRTMVAENVLDRLDALESAVRDILNDALTPQAADPENPDWTGISGWVATGTSLRDFYGRIVLDATVPSITLATGGVIESANYVAATSGFHIDGGVAEFNDVVIRGTIYATVGAIGGWTIGATELKAGSGANTVGLDSGGTNPAIYAGSATPGSAPFRVTQAGVLFAQGATIQSAGSGARVVLDGTGIKGYDATTQRYQVSNDGSGWLGSSSIFSWTTAGVVSLNGSAVMPNTILGGKVNFFNVPVIDGLTLQNNTPLAGQVTFSTFTLTYQGVSYTVVGTNTASKYAYWNKAMGTTWLQFSATPPAAANDQFVIFINNGGLASYVIFANIIYADYISVVNLAAVSANMGSLHIDGVLDIGAAGGIYQGTGTFAAPTTGLKIWNDSGVGRIAGYNTGVIQTYFGTDGKLYAGAGTSVLDASGLSLTSGTSTYNQIKWYVGGDLKAYVHSQITDDEHAYGYLNLRALPTGDGSLINLWAGNAYAKICIADYTDMYFSLDHTKAPTSRFVWEWVSSSTYAQLMLLDQAGTARILGGLYVGSLGTDPGVDNLVVDGALTYNGTNATLDMNGNATLKGVVKCASGTTASLVQYAQESIIVSAAAGVYLVYTQSNTAAGGNTAWSGCWLVAVDGNMTISLMGAGGGLTTCVQNGSNIDIANLSTSAATITWGYLRIR